MANWFDNILMNLPEVAGPTQKKLSFKEKLKWTLIVLVVFFILGTIPLFGLGENALTQFEILQVILGASFGSIISLGIGPIVTASIVLQLLNGTGIIKMDTTTHEGKRRFQGIQKLLSIGFILFEAIIFVFMGGLAPGVFYNAASHSFTATAVGNAIALTSGQILSLKLLLVFQLFLGGIMILLMDEIVSKWGFGSGISLFIAAGVSQQLFTRALSWVRPETNPESFVGAIPEMIRAFGIGEPQIAGIMLASILATVGVFVMAVYGQAMKVEIPLSFGRIRGHGIRWPLHFLYTSNIPVILVAALLANMQLWARLLDRWGRPCI